MMCIEIESEDLHNSFKSHFDALWGQDTKVEKGMDAFKRMIFEVLDNLEPGDSYNVLGAGYGPKGKEKEYADLFREIHEYRFKKGIHGKLLFDHSAAETLKKYKKEFYDTKDAEYRLLPYTTESPVEVFTSKDTTYLSIQEEEEPIVITIKNKKITESFKKQFESFWKTSKS